MKKIKETKLKNWLRVLYVIVFFSPAIIGLYASMFGVVLTDYQTGSMITLSIVGILLLWVFIIATNDWP